MIARPSGKSVSLLQALADAPDGLKLAALAEALGETDKHGVDRVQALMKHLATHGRIEQAAPRAGPHGATWRITDVGREWLADTLAEHPEPKPDGASTPRAAPARNAGVPKGKGLRARRVAGATDVPLASLARPSQIEQRIASTGSVSTPTTAASCCSTATESSRG